ncbi:S1C family serine protease [Porticoccus sp. GXU_MW_L64]
MSSIAAKLLVAIGLLISLGQYSHSVESSAAQLFSDHQHHIYQIRLIDLAADKKTSLGSGFLVTGQGVIATNYHVIESAISHPDKYRIEYLDAEGNVGPLELLDINVINDLALLKSDQLVMSPLGLAEQKPQQGETIYAIGNPHDIGFTVVPGTYNNVNDASYYRRIHFTGSINPGMSGGPVLNGAGEVVGINVSTGGNQISFLVPVDVLRSLLTGYGERAQRIADFKAYIGQQLYDNQKNLIDGIVAKDWPTETIGEASALAEMRPYVKCWGNSTDKDKKFQRVMSTCQGSEHIYLNPGFTTGTVNYQFFWLQADKLNPWQFYRRYENLLANFVSDNVAGKDDVSEYACEELFVAKQQSDKPEKAVLCVRAYRDYKGLYDAFFVGGSLHHNHKAFIRHFSLTGVSRESVQKFMARFVEVAAWR